MEYLFDLINHERFKAFRKYYTPSVWPMLPQVKKIFFHDWATLSVNYIVYFCVNKNSSII